MTLKCGKMAVEMEVFHSCLHMSMVSQKRETERLRVIGTGISDPFKSSQVEVIFLSSIWPKGRPKNSLLIALKNLSAIEDFHPDEVWSISNFLWPETEDHVCGQTFDEKSHNFSRRVGSGRKY